MHYVDSRHHPYDLLPRAPRVLKIRDAKNSCKNSINAVSLRVDALRFVLKCLLLLRSPLAIFPPCLLRPVVGPRWSVSIYLSIKFSFAKIIAWYTTFFKLYKSFTGQLILVLHLQLLLLLLLLLLLFTHKSFSHQR